MKFCGAAAIGSNPVWRRPVDPASIARRGAAFARRETLKSAQPLAQPASGRHPIGPRDQFTRAVEAQDAFFTVYSASQGMNNMRGSSSHRPPPAGFRVKSPRAAARSASASSPDTSVSSRAHNPGPLSGARLAFSVRTTTGAELALAGENLDREESPLRAAAGRAFAPTEIRRACTAIGDVSQHTLLRTRTAVPVPRRTAAPLACAIERAGRPAPPPSTGSTRSRCAARIYFRPRRVP